MGLLHVELNGEIHPVETTISKLYALEGGELVIIPAGPAWCGGCRAFVDAEHLPSLDELDQRIAKAEWYRARPGQVPEIHEDWQVHYDMRDIAALRLKREWRARRVGPPKCLECGSTDVWLLPDKEWVEIPGVGRCRSTIKALSSGPPPLEKFYTPEGLRIRGAVLVEELRARVARGNEEQRAAAREWLARRLPNRRR